MARELFGKKPKTDCPQPSVYPETLDAKTLQATASKLITGTIARLSEADPQSLCRVESNNNSEQQYFDNWSKALGLPGQSTDRIGSIKTS